MSRRCIVLLGPPGAGKGTQAAALARHAGLQHVSTGDLLRKAIAEGSELGRRVKATVEGGRLVDDETVAALVGLRLDADGGGLLLDGYPRNVPQALRLAELLQDRGRPEPLVIEIRLADDEVVRRLAARRSCSEHGPLPPGATACDRCGAQGVARADDGEEVVRERLRVYAAQTAPLTRHYQELGLLRTVDGNAPPAEVESRIREVVPA